MIVWRPSDLFGREPAISGTLTAEASGVSVVDGETLLLRKTVVRLQGVSAPARGVSCARAQGDSFDCGAAATEALAGIVRDLPVACRLLGRNDEGFVEGRCEAGHIDVNQAIIGAGWARADGDFADLAVFQDGARAARRGVWQTGGPLTF